MRTWGADNQADATLLWWLGWVRLQQKQYEPAEQAFTRCVAKFPEYVNSWFYVAVCRFSRQDQSGAVFTPTTASTAMAINTLTEKGSPTVKVTIYTRSTAAMLQMAPGSNP